MCILKFLNAPLLGYSTENHTNGKKIETGLMRRVSIGVSPSQCRVYRYGHVYKYNTYCTYKHIGIVYPERNISVYNINTALLFSTMKAIL